jgi:hypothetical protein
MDNSERENRWVNQEWTFQREKTDGEIKNGHFRERKPIGKSRMDISEKENRWENQEWTSQREKTDGEIKNGHFREKNDGENKNGHFRERKPMGKSRMDIAEKENRWENQDWTFKRE